MTEPQTFFNAECPICFKTTAGGLILSNTFTLYCNHILCKVCYKGMLQTHQSESNQPFILICPCCREAHKPTFQQIHFEKSDPTTTQIQFTNFRLATNDLQSIYRTLLGFYSEYAPPGYITDCLLLVQT